MLSRVANSIYWMARYVERAENLARFIDVTLHVILDYPDEHGEHWRPLVNTTGDEKYFEKHYGEPSAENVLHFLTFDREYHSSILTSLSIARENARTVREAISSEAWEQLNTYYHFVRNAADSGMMVAKTDFYDTVRQHSHLFHGILDATMTRGTGWHFANVGRLLERADKSSRILDVKYFTLLRTVSDVDTTFDDLLWSAVLRSVSGFEMFRKRYHTLTIHRVVEFLILDRRFPRTILYCVLETLNSLLEVAGPVPPEQNPAIQHAGKLVERLKSANAEIIINGGMHEFIDSVQGELNEIGAAIHDTYFTVRPFSSTLDVTQSQSQSQSQSQNADSPCV